MATNTPRPGEFIEQELEARGWTQRDLADILGRTLATVNEIIRSKRGLTTETAVALGQAFGTGPEIWLQREADYRVSLAGQPDNAIRLRARCYDFAPVKEMERRQWIHPTNTPDELEGELKHFFRVTSLDREPELGVALRAPVGDTLTPSQRAWCFRVLQLAEAVAAAEYREDRMSACMRELRQRAAYPQEAHKVSGVLAAYGVRMVVVEPLAGTKVDGVALWLDNKSPVIGVSIRYDRIDGFWFTLCHELAHIIHRHQAPIDVDMPEKILLPTAVRPEMERLADNDAAAMLVPKTELESFVLRVSPLYSKDKIIRFANRIKIHPGIIVGQLQHRGELGYRANREMLVKIRDYVTSVALTDGWGLSIDPGVFK